MFDLPKKPQGVGAVIDTAFRLYKAGFRKWIWLTMALALLQLAGFLMLTLALGIRPGLPPMALRPGPSGFIAVNSLLQFITRELVYAAIVYRLAAIMQDRETGFRDTAARALRSLFPLILCTLMTGLAVLGGLIALIVPGVILLFGLWFGPLLVVLERKGPYAALRESYRLVSGNRGGVVYAMMLGVVIWVVVQSGTFYFAAISMTLAHVTPVAIGWITGALQILDQVFLAPVLAAITVVKYFDLKVRKSGADLKERMLALA